MGKRRDGTAADYITQALLLLMRRKDYHDISVTALCEKAGTTRMSFYRSFESKEDVLAKYITRITAEFIEKTGISYERDTTQEYFVKLLTHMKAQQWFCEALLRAGLIYLVKDEFDRVFLRVYAGKYDAYKSSFLAGGIYNVFLFWLTNGCPETPEALAEKLTGLLEK